MSPSRRGKAGEGRGYREKGGGRGIFRGTLAAEVRGPSHRALGVDAAQMGLEVAHAPAAVAAQLQVAVALVRALHQQRDGLRLGLRLDLHVCYAVGSAALQDASQAASVAHNDLDNDFRHWGASPAPRAPFIGTLRQGSADRTLCGCRPLAEAEATAPTWPNPSTWVRADATRRLSVTGSRGYGPGARLGGHVWVRCEPPREEETG